MFIYRSLQGLWASAVWVSLRCPAGASRAWRSGNSGPPRWVRIPPRRNLHKGRPTEQGIQKFLSHLQNVTLSPSNTYQNILLEKLPPIIPYPTKNCISQPEGDIKLNFSLKFSTKRLYAGNYKTKFPTNFKVIFVFYYFTKIIICFRNVRYILIENIYSMFF